MISHVYVEKRRKIDLKFRRWRTSISLGKRPLNNVLNRIKWKSFKFSPFQATDGILGNKVAGFKYVGHEIHCKINDTFAKRHRERWRMVDLKF